MQAIRRHVERPREGRVAKAQGEAEVGVLMTNVCQCTGPGTVPVLLGGHGTLACHDGAFVDPAAARRFEIEHPGSVALAAQDPSAIAEKLARLDLCRSTP